MSPLLVGELLGDHTKTNQAYLPAGQITSWGRGIALIARQLAR